MLRDLEAVHLELFIELNGTIPGLAVTVTYRYKLWYCIPSWQCYATNESAEICKRLHMHCKLYKSSTWLLLDPLHTPMPNTTFRTCRTAQVLSNTSKVGLHIHRQAVQGMFREWSKNPSPKNRRLLLSKPRWWTLQRHWSPALYAGYNKLKI